MENHCVTVSFSFRGSKANKEGLSSIECSISYNGERIYFSTGKFARPNSTPIEGGYIKQGGIPQGKKTHASNL